METQKRVHKMKRTITTYSLLAVLLSITISAQTLEEISIVPQPAHLELLNGRFTFNSSTKILTDDKEETTGLANLLAGAIKNLTGLQMQISTASQDTPQNSVRIIIDPAIQNVEEYFLSIKKDEITIKSQSGAGIFYALQTLFQLFPAEPKNELAVPCAEIKDYPRFKWRGVHLDVCRHFFPVEFVKKYIDILAMYKMNTFHWHLTEDQGWRIEIKKYPKLTEVGAWRKEADGKLYGGFYTQDQIREIVQYAKEKYITVVPEIEMPGHSLAALAAYPELSCTGGPFEVGNLWGVIEDVYCAGNDNTFEFLQNVLTEVMDLFPSEYIHIGGDEVPKVRWENCEKCQVRIKNENLKDEHELQSYFIQRIEKFVNSKGKRIIGWDEILEGGLAPNAAVMSWRGTEGGIAAAKMSHNVVMSPGTHCYFDHYQALSGEPKAIGGYTTLEKVYSYEPVPEVLNDEETKYIMGAQANMWTEYMETTNHVEYMLLPRMCTLSEVVWSPKESRNLTDFLQRMSHQYNLLASKNYNFRIPTPFAESGEYLITDSEEIALNSPIKNSKIFYTLDGSEPTSNSTLYTEPLSFSEDGLLKAKTFLANGKTSTTSSIAITLIDTTENGLYYKYFEGEWDSIPNFWELRAETKGKVQQISLSEIKHAEDHFGLDIFGFIEIDEEGEYTFYLTSDDGSNLYIDNKIVVYHDGTHAPTEKSGKVYLDSGRYPFKIFYFERGGGQDLKVEYEGPDINKKQIPASKLFFDNY